jgi:hypothetical protein
MVDKDGLVSKEEYLWNFGGMKTGKAGELLRYTAHTDRAEPLWIEIETAFDE